jgi:hypothetical protein
MERIITEYRTVIGGENKTFWDQEINGLINDGWQPYGFPSHNLLMQTMVKYETTGKRPKEFGEAKR